MKKVKIPAQLFVTSLNRPEYVYETDPETGAYGMKQQEDHNFGFLHPHEPNTKPDAKRKHTQMTWAYSGSEVYEKDGVWWERGEDRKWDYSTYEVDRKSTLIVTPYDRPIDPMYAPKIWDNIPLSGFKLIDTVNRYRGNKLFKVLDPRGIEFEVTVQSLFTILTEGTVSKGEILNECVWKAGKNLIIVS